MNKNEYDVAKSRIKSADANIKLRVFVDDIRALLRSTTVTPVITVSTPQNCQRTYRVERVPYPRLFNRLQEAMVAALDDEYEELIQEYEAI